MSTRTAEPLAPARVGLDPRIVLQSAWVFAVLNYLYCDVLTLMVASQLRQYLDGNVGGVEVTPGFLLAAGVLMEIPMSMVLVSRLAPHRSARVATIIGGAIMTVVQAASLSFGTEGVPHYLFFSVIEISTTAFIVWFAWRWRAEG